MRILIATDSFPPGCGGSGWSTYELCRGLRSAGHEITVVRPVPGRDERVREAHYDLFRVLEFGTAAPRLPYVRNYFKNERLYRRLEPFLAETIRRERLEIVHAQHVLTAVPSVAAARHVGVPVAQHGLVVVVEVAVVLAAFEAAVESSATGHFGRVRRPRV